MYKPMTRHPLHFQAILIQWDGKFQEFFKKYTRTECTVCVDWRTTWCGCRQSPSLIFTAWPRHSSQLSKVFTTVWVPDPYSCGSVLKWLPWIRICIGNRDSRSGSRTVKMKTKKGGKCEISSLKQHFAEGLMVFTWAWKSLIKVFLQFVPKNGRFFFVKMLGFSEIFCCLFLSQKTWFKI